MKKLTAFTLLLFLYQFCSAQTFPKSFVGHWKGELVWHQTGQPIPRKTTMQLIIRPTDTADHYTWQIIYGDKGQDNRPYILMPVDAAKGHWVVDERNGILLDQYWVGNRLAAAFTVDTFSTILNSTRVEGDSMIVEFQALSAKPVATTGLGTQEVPSVYSYAVRSYQKAILRRVKPVKK